MWLHIHQGIMLTHVSKRVPEVTWIFFSKIQMIPKEKGKAGNNISACIMNLDCPQRAHDASSWCQNDVATSFRRHNDVIIASCTIWICSLHDRHSKSLLDGLALISSAWRVVTSERTCQLIWPIWATWHDRQMEALIAYCGSNYRGFRDIIIQFIVIQLTPLSLAMFATRNIDNCFDPCVPEWTSANGHVSVDALSSWWYNFS